MKRHNLCKCGKSKYYQSEKCGECEKKSRSLLANMNRSLPLDQRLMLALKKGPSGLSDLATVTEVSEGRVLDELNKLKRAGRNLHTFGNSWSLERVQETGGIKDKPLVSDASGWHIIGAMGDTHMCSKQERLDALKDMYRIYAANGIKTVLHTGNYIDGECRFNKYELKVHGMDAQLAYMGEHYPQIPGIDTYMVSGDDHEGWYAQREGVNIGHYMYSVMRRGGRRDIHDLGYMECFIPLQHRKSGKTSMVHVIHPGGGSAYAISYTTQKQIESYEGGEKPAVALIGHYHKSEYLLSRNVHAFQTGCFQDQTVFMRKKKLIASVGGWIVMLRQNPETGAIEEVVSYFKSYYNRGYYQNQRWSLSGPVSQVPRVQL